MSKLLRRGSTWAAVLLAVHAALLAYGAVVHSPAIDEVGHFPAGLGVWEQGRFDLYCVNPPLVRSVAMLPVWLAADLKVTWTNPDSHPAHRPEFQIGRQLIEQNAPEVFWWFTIARWTCIPFSLLAGVMCYVWANALFSPLPQREGLGVRGDSSPLPEGEGLGVRARLPGLLALTLWCFDPMILGNAQMITPDTGAAAFGLLATYLFWKWLKQPTWTDAFLAGVALGLAELCKASWIILFPLWPTLWLLTRRGNLTTDRTDNTDQSGSSRSASVASSQKTLPIRVIRVIRGQTAQLAFILLLGLYVLNLGYAFDGTFTRLADFEFVSKTLKGDTEAFAGNRFEATWLGTIPAPLPKFYVMGIDVQKRDFEAGFLSYLRGEWRREGWWYYYLYGLAVKMPVGTLLLILASFAALAHSAFAPSPPYGERVGVRGRGFSPGWRNELVLYAPALVLFVLVSSQTGFNHHVRYVVPCLPFLFIGCGRLALVWRESRGTDAFGPTSPNAGIKTLT